MAKKKRNSNSPAAIRSRALKAARVAEGLCYECGLRPPKKTSTRCQRCLNQLTIYDKLRRQRLIAEGRCSNCGTRLPKKSQAKVSGRKAPRCQGCIDKSVLRARQRRREDKLIVINHYGGKCVECPETDMRVLTVDHVDGGGSIERENTKHSGGFYRWLAKQILAGTVKSRLQLLCFNCHAKKDLCPWWLKSESA